eukprot:Nk52_evm26s230 gene=Nk52_evmTU26s230
MRAAPLLEVVVLVVLCAALLPYHRVEAQHIVYVYTTYSDNACTQKQNGPATIEFGKCANFGSPFHDYMITDSLFLFAYDSTNGTCTTRLATEGPYQVNVCNKMSSNWMKITVSTGRGSEEEEDALCKQIYNPELCPKECFPGSAQVLAKDNESDIFSALPMASLRVGMVVKTLYGESPVIDFLHMNRNTLGKNYVEISFTTGDALVLSAAHQVLRVCEENLVSSSCSLNAKDVRPGMFLWRGNTGEKAEVTSVSLQQHHQGLYAPLTADGTIQVNNIGVSCYANEDHYTAHAVMAPYRIFHLARWYLIGLGFGSDKQVQEDVSVPQYANVLMSIRHALYGTS